jgi:hypothetical protein
MHGDDGERQDDVRIIVPAIALGVLTTMVGASLIGDGHDYREDISPWFRSIFLLLHPRADSESRHAERHVARSLPQRRRPRRRQPAAGQ